MKRSRNEPEPRYYINGNDAYPPIRYKETQRHHRRNKEFPTLVKREAYKRAEACCELCNTQLSLKKAHFHHILSLSYAFHYYPDIPDEILKSVENCQVLCEQCHTDLHQRDSLAYYETIAHNLIALIATWEPLEHPLRHKKKKKRKREHAEQFEAAVNKRKRKLNGK